MKQVSSKKKSAAAFKFGSETRDGQNRRYAGPQDGPGPKYRAKKALGRQVGALVHVRVRVWRVVVYHSAAALFGCR